MKIRHAALLASFVSLAACAAVPPTQGGSNANDRSNGGEQGEALLTGAMVISPDGKYALAQRNQTSVLIDLQAKTANELPWQAERFVFAKNGGVAFAILPNAGDVIAFDLASRKEKWRVTPAFVTSAGASLARASDDGKHLLLGDYDRVLVLDAENGAVRNALHIGSIPTDLAFVPGSAHALVVGTTRWADHKPLTDVVDVDLANLATKPIQVPNCNAPIEVLPDASRAFLSPTFCEEGVASTGQQKWTNPDPVSVIDLPADGPHFLKNLPGFGPVAVTPGGAKVVAYLDMQRIDRTMFDDQAQIPSDSGPRYHIMTIDPKTLAFQLSPIGNVLPRFALTKDGKSLLVDATVQQFRGEATVKATIDSSGKISASIQVFGKTDSLFGTFDLSTNAYTAFAGQPASLDRFVQMGDNKRVFTLKMLADGSGGSLYRIDIGGGAAVSLNKSLRDIGLLADESTLLLRERLPAVQVQTSAGVDWYRREQYCLSLDGVSMLSCIDFQDSKPFQSGPKCTDYHDC